MVVVAVTLMSVVFFAFCILRVALRTGVAVLYVVLLSTQNLRRRKSTL